MPLNYTDKVVVLAGYAEHVVGVDQVAAVVEVFNALPVAALADGRDDQVGFNGVFLAALDSNGRIVFPHAVDEFHAGCAAFIPVMNWSSGAEPAPESPESCTNFLFISSHPGRQSEKGRDISRG